MTWLQWPQAANVRDLGGLRTLDGMTTQLGRLVRSGDHSTLTGAGRQALDTYGITTIIDLRSTLECHVQPSPFAEDPRYHHRPIDAAIDEAPSLLDLYKLILHRAAGEIGAILTHIAQATSPVVVHCHAGKDRTGIVVALALTAAEVQRDDIIADYARTDHDPITATNHQRRLAAITNPDDRRVWTDRISARPETMASVFQHLDRAYEGPERYLRNQAGLADHVVSQLRTRLTSADTSRDHPAPGQIIS